MPRRSKTPGVKLIKRQRAEGVTWYGRWQDPVSRRWVDANLTREGITTDVARRQWADKQSERLRDQRRGRALGRPEAGLTLLLLGSRVSKRRW